MKTKPRLFASSMELNALLRKIEHRREDSAHDLLRRLDAQRTAAEGLGKFGKELDPKRYTAARELLPMVVSGFMPVDRLRTLLLELEVDFVTAAGRAARSTSNKRFANFYEKFDELARRRTHRDAASVYQAILDSGIEPPYPRLSSAKTHYRDLMRAGSERLRIIGR